MTKACVWYQIFWIDFQQVSILFSWKQGIGCLKVHPWVPKHYSLRLHYNSLNITFSSEKRDHEEGFLQMLLTYTKASSPQRHEWATGHNQVWGFGFVWLRDMGSSLSLVSQGMTLRKPGLIFLSYKMERLYQCQKWSISKDILTSKIRTTIWRGNFKATCVNLSSTLEASCGGRYLWVNPMLCITIVITITNYNFLWGKHHLGKSSCVSSPSCSLQTPFLDINFEVSSLSLRFGF